LSSVVFPAPFGPDDADGFRRPEAKVDVRDGHERTESFREAARDEDVIRFVHAAGQLYGSSLFVTGIW
jgi:hypothetical protein